MNAKELRIGNYIWNTYGFLQTITAEDILDLSNYSNFKPERCQYFTPIPLTEEWLLKLGFQKEAPYFYLDPLKIHNNTVWYAKELISEINIHYIHQLQNLYFALTEKELEIKL